MKNKLKNKKHIIMFGMFALILIGVVFLITSFIKGTSKAAGVVYDGIYLEYKDDIEEEYIMFGTFPDELYEEEKEKNNKDDDKEKKKSLDDRVYDAYFNKVKMSKCSFKMSSNVYKWTGKEIKPNISVSYNGNELKKNKEYTMEYFNNIQNGTAYVNITGKGTYRGCVTIKYDIVGIDIAEKCSFELKDGKVIMKYNDEEVEEREYDVRIYHRDMLVSKSYNKRKYVRITYYEIRGKGRFQGTYELRTQKNIEDQ